MKEINLRVLFCSKKSELPDWIDARNCIYLIRNLVTGKPYVGQAKWFYGRFVANKSYYTHKYGVSVGGQYIHNSIRKHGSRNFIVSIIEENLKNRIEMNQRESYWIDYYDSYYNGYNCDLGGYDMTPCHTKESIARKIATDKKNHGGKLAINSEESIRRSQATLTRIYGNPFGTINNPEVYNRLKKERGGDYMAHCHTPEARVLKLENERKNHDGTLAFNTPEALEASLATRIERYGHKNGVLGNPEIRKKAVATEYQRYGGLVCHNEVNHMRSTITQLFNSINKILSKLPENPTYDDYKSNCSCRHLDKVLHRLNQLSADERWTQKLQNIFKDHLDLTNSDK